MTKKEQAAMTEAINKAEILGALRWSEPIEKDLPPPDSRNWDQPGYQAYTQGWEMNLYTQKVYKAWSGSVSHGTGDAPVKGTYFSASQRECALYSTRKRALQALRYAIAFKAAQDLRTIDQQLAKDTEEEI